MTAALDDSTALYGEALDQIVQDRATLQPREAAALGWPSLAGARSAWLANALGEPWLRLVENDGAAPNAPFRHHGWLSLEVAVQNVDALADTLANTAFEIIGEPADLAMSDAIRAMQVAGPSGEVLYLTEVKRAVPPFELPRARCPVDRLFIPVMTCADREAALAHYEALSGNEGLRFDTRITVISRALGLEPEHEHPVATLQLAGETLIEIDEVPGLEPAPFGADEPPTGIALVHFGFAGADQAAAPAHPATGAAGERYLLTPQQGTTS